MPYKDRYKVGPPRVSYLELCARLKRHGFTISHLGHKRVEDSLQLELMVVNQNNLYLQVEGKIGPPNWGEELFLKILGQVQNFGVS